MTTKRSSYDQGCDLTHEVVGRFKIFGSGLPEFAMPGGEVALIGSLAVYGQALARNDAARELLAQLIAETERRQLDDYPTIMMLEACLEMHGIPITRVALEDLGIEGRLLTRNEVEGRRRTGRKKN